MRQRERVAQRPGIVHQHIRMHAEHTARERAGLLAVVLIHVDPAFGERAVQQLLVFLAQRQRRLLDQLLRVFKRDGIVDVLYDGDIQIKHVDFVELERAAAQLQIFAHGGQALVHGLDQAVIDGHGHIAAVQRRLARGGVAALIGEIGVEFDGAAIERGNGVAELPVGAEHGTERTLAHGAVAALAEDRERTGGKAYLLARLIFDHRQLQVNVGQHLKRGLRRACRVAQQRQHLLPRSVERMRAHTDDIVYRVPVGRQRLVLHPLVQLFCRDRKNFGVQERRCGAELDEQAFAAGGHFLILRNRAVLCLLQKRIGIRQLNFEHRGVDGVKPLLERFLGRAECAGNCGQRCKRGLSLLHCGFPRRSVRVDLRQVPLEPDILLASFHSVSSFIDTSIIMTKIFPVNVRCGWEGSCFFVIFRVK